MDFAGAEEDPVTGELCLTRRVCLADPGRLARRILPQPQPCLAPGCNCGADDHCANATAPFCVGCRCKPRVREWWIRLPVLILKCSDSCRMSSGPEKYYRLQCISVT